ncbi:hypothetical protein [Loigolactobacillus binensis]|uniref:Uncharacterized protein n=1 Tax=Loigolactobacillus binensis TaxID=2559922 RepID=A0ABW3EBK4_9LACO|nr:hypothetical protein [Loigolactobacillus binensis]
MINVAATSAYVLVCMLVVGAAIAPKLMTKITKGHGATVLKFVMGIKTMLN